MAGRHRLVRSTALALAVLAAFGFAAWFVPAQARITGPGLDDQATPPITLPLENPDSVSEPGSSLRSEPAFLHGQTLDDPQAGAGVYFEPATAVVELGVAFTVTVNISGVVDLGGFEFDLLFDPALITVTDAYLGSFLGDSGNPVVALGPSVDEAGRLVFGGFSYGPNEGASGSGSLATLCLTLLAPTATILRLEDVQLLTSSAEPAPLQSVGEGHIAPAVRLYLPLVKRRQ
jgi:hypothetical protein